MQPLLLSAVPVWPVSDHNCQWLSGVTLRVNHVHVERCCSQEVCVHLIWKIKWNKLCKPKIYTQNLLFQTLHEHENKIKCFFSLSRFTLKKVINTKKLTKCDNMFHCLLGKKKLIALTLTDGRKKPTINSPSLLGYAWINEWFLLF